MERQKGVASSAAPFMTEPAWKAEVFSPGRLRSVSRRQSPPTKSKDQVVICVTKRSSVQIEIAKLAFTPLRVARPERHFPGQSLAAIEEVGRHRTEDFNLPIA